MKRGVAVAVLTLLIVVIVRCRSSEPRRSRYVTEDPQRRAHLALSAQVFRALFDDQQLRAKQLRRTYQPHATGPDGIGRSLIEPACILGEGELCKMLADPIAACDGGDAASCLAIGQMLSETAPRPLVAVLFFRKACELADTIACDRLKALDAPARAASRCEDDVFACAWLAYRAHDLAGLDEACGLGVADACLMMLANTVDPTLERAYLESACQLGAAQTCALLDARLSIGCSLDVCYPPDPDEAATAHAIACSAGWSEGC